MNKLKELLKLSEEIDNSKVVRDIAEEISNEMNKALGGVSAIRSKETGNAPGKLFTTIEDKNWNNGKLTARFRIPVVDGSRASGVANNKEKFEAAFNKIVWPLRNKGWVIQQPIGVPKTGWQGDGYSGTIMEFHISK